MKYLFFDIECSNCFGGYNKICEFGYVLTDEHFNILKKEDIPIAPGDINDKNSKFDLSIYKRDPSFKWAYSFEEYFSQPTFPHFYNTLKELLEDEDTLVFGYAVINDVKYLGTEFIRYQLEPFKYKVCEVGILINCYIDSNYKANNLAEKFKYFCSEEEFSALRHHYAADDAYMTMRMLQEALKKNNLTLQEIISQCPNAIFDSYEFLQEYLKNIKTKEEIRKENSKIWKEFCAKYSHIKGLEKSKGRLVSISSFIKSSDKKTLNRVIHYIIDNHYIPCKKSSNSDFLIVINKKDIELMLKSFNGKIYEGKYVFLEEVKEYLKCKNK